jgi:hypothetical protein
MTAATPAPWRHLLPELAAQPTPPPRRCPRPGREGPSKRIIAIAKAVQECAFAWEPDAQLLNNVRAEDVADLCSAVLARWGR